MSESSNMEDNRTDLNPQDKVQQLLSVFKAPAHKGLLQNTSLCSSMPPLIVNVGVGLPDPDLAVGMYRHQWRNYFRDEIFPRLIKFSPDIIFISAGFDAHKKDTINSGYIALVEEDFDWVTTGLIRVANSCCNGRIVSALEGGYQIGGEFCSAFAKSVKTHVASLIRGNKTTAPYDQAEMECEKLYENEIIQDAERRRLAKIALIRQREEVELAKQRSDISSALRDSEIAKVDSNNIETEAETDFSSARKRRRAATNVDYIALSKKLTAEKEL